MTEASGQAAAGDRDRGGLFCGERFDFFVQSRLVPGRFILVHDALTDHSVDQRQCIGQGGARRGCVSGIDCRVDALHICAHHGPLAGIVAATLFGLACALTGLWTVSQ